MKKGRKKTSPVWAVGVFSLLGSCLLAWTAPPSPSAQTGFCAIDGSDRDTSASAVAFAAKYESPIKYEYDSGFRPSRKLGMKVFYYASGGELDVKAAGDLRSWWVPGLAYPGAVLPVTLDALGDRSKSRWQSDGGLRFGSRYRYDVDIDLLFSNLHFGKEDYLPRVPNLDISWPCDTDVLPFALTNDELACVRYWAEGNKACFINLDYGNYTVPDTCKGSDTQWSFSYEYCFSEDPGEDEENDEESYCLVLRPNPAVRVYVCGELGFCTTFDLVGDSLVDTGSPDRLKITQEHGTMGFGVKIPCDFAQATDGERTFYFTRGPFKYDGNLLFKLVAKVKPIFKPCFVEFAKVIIEVGGAACALVLPNPLYQTQYPLPFSEMDATFAVELADPELCDITPSSGSVIAGETTTVTWGTTWGARDSCGCRAKAYYHIRQPGTTPWSPWKEIADTLNEGSIPWEVDWVSALKEAEIKIEFEDPNGHFLDSLNGGQFFIDIPPFCIAWPGLIDFGYLPVGTKDTTFIITNAGGDILDGDLSPPVTDDFNLVSPPPGPFSLAAGETLTVAVSYDPQSPGPHNDVIETGNELCSDVQLTGGNLPMCVVWPDTLYFGAVPTSQSRDTTFFITNTGGGAVTGNVSAACSDFSITVGAGEFRLANAETLHVTVEYTPPDVGEHSCTVLTGGGGCVTVGCGGEGVYGGTGIHSAGPPKFVLFQNRPNPFNATTLIDFGLDQGGRTLLQVYDISGKLVRTVVDGEMPPGWHSRDWDGRDAKGRRVASGVYFYRLESPAGIQTRKLVVIR
jgi:hypothetical protein